MRNKTVNPPNPSSKAGCDINQQDAKEDGLQKYHEQRVHLERFRAQGLTVGRESPPGYERRGKCNGLCLFTRKRQEDSAALQPRF